MASTTLCMVCNRPLRSLKSIQQGMGPACAKKVHTISNEQPKEEFDIRKVTEQEEHISYEIKAKAIKVLDQLQQGKIVWKPGSEDRHVKKRIKRGHLPENATVQLYRTIILDVVKKEAALLRKYDQQLLDNVDRMYKHISKAYDFSLSKEPFTEWWWHLDKLVSGELLPPGR